MSSSGPKRGVLEAPTDGTSEEGLGSGATSPARIPVLGLKTPVSAGEVRAFQHQSLVRPRSQIRESWRPARVAQAQESFGRN